MAKETIAETEQIVPRYYGLSFLNGNTKVFDNPSTAAFAYIALLPADRSDGLINMIEKWQKRKPLELEGKFGYIPIFNFPNVKLRKKLFESKSDVLVTLIREAIKKNHKSYNLFDCSGKDAVDTDNLVLRGDDLTAIVRSREGGVRQVYLKGAVLGKDGEIRYKDSGCTCADSLWMDSKGGRAVIRKNCMHIKAAETASYLQRDVRLLHPAQDRMKVKNPNTNNRSLTWNFIDNPFLKNLLIDVLVAYELGGESLYQIDRKLLTPPIAQAIMPLNLQQEVSSGKANFEILLQQRNKIKKIDETMLNWQRIAAKALSLELYNQGFRFNGYCLELDQPAAHYENSDYSVNLLIDHETNLPFYFVKDKSNSKALNQGIFTPDYGPANPSAQTSGKQWRVDDRTRRSMLGRARIPLEIKLDENKDTRSLRFSAPESIKKAYSLARDKAIAQLKK